METPHSIFLPSFIDLFSIFVAVPFYADLHNILILQSIDCGSKRLLINGKSKTGASFFSVNIIDFSFF